MDFEASRQWNWRRHANNRMVFAEYKHEHAIKDVQDRALRVLRSYCDGAGMGETDLEGPFWALTDTCHQKEAMP